MRLLRHSTGQVVELESATPIGVGGEARVYSVAQEPGLAAKVYHKPTEEKARKLGVMFANPPEDPTTGAVPSTIAWPLDLLRSPDSRRAIVGFLMTRASGMHPIFHFYNPSTRRLEHPLSNYFYLHRTARNLASAVRALHQRGYVIGDVNESNILVTETALVRLVDTDSFQVRDPESNAIFRCPVGKMEFTPPELIGKPFAEIDRTPEHDLFGLSVLIFQLLMEGTHPFAGIYQGADDPPPYETRIQYGHFPHGTRPVPYKPMPAAPPFTLLHPSLQRLFLRCFEEGYRVPAARPSAEEWRDALESAEQSLATCPKNSQHWYPDHLARCPWCERAERLGGRDPFPSRAAVQRGAHRQRRPGLTTTSETVVRPNYAPQPSRSGLPATPSGSATVWAYSAPPAGAPVSPIQLTSNWWALIALLLATISFVPNFHLLAGLAAIGVGVVGWKKARAYQGSGRGMSALGIVLGSCMAAIPVVFPPPRGVLGETGRVSAVAFSPDGKLLAVGTRRSNDPSNTGGTVSVYDTESERFLETLPAHRGDVTALAFSPQGRALSVASWGSLEPGNLDIWDFNLKRSRWATIAHKNTIRAVAYSPDGRLLATAGSYEYVRTRQSYAEVRVWDTQTGKEIRRFENKGEAFAVAFSPDSRSLATASGSSGSGASFRVAEPGHVRVYDVQTGALRWEQRAHSTAALCLAYDPTGRYLASSGYGNTIRLWNPQNGTLIRALDSEGLRVASIAFFPDGRRLVSGGEDRLVTLWDVETGKPQRKWTGHAAEVVTVACASDGKTIASGSTDGIVRLWRLPR